MANVKWHLMKEKDIAGFQGNIPFFSHENLILCNIVEDGWIDIPAICVSIISVLCKP